MRMRRRSTGCRLAVDGWHPLVDNHEALERSERANAILHHGSEGAASRQPRSRAGFGPESTEDPLLDLYHALLPFGIVFVKPNGEVGGEAQPVVDIDLEPSDQVDNCGIRRASALPRRGGCRVAYVAVGDNRAVGGDPDLGVCGVVLRRGAGLFQFEHPIPGIGQQRHHVGGASRLAGILSNAGQFTNMMRIAQSVCDCGVYAIGRPALVDQDAGQACGHVDRLRGHGTPPLVEMRQRETLLEGQIDRVERGSNPQVRLVGMVDVGEDEQLESSGRQHGHGRHRYAVAVGQHVGHPLDGDVHPELRKQRRVFCRRDCWMPALRTRAARRRSAGQEIQEKRGRFKVPTDGAVLSRVMDRAKQTMNS